MSRSAATAAIVKQRVAEDLRFLEAQEEAEPRLEGRGVLLDGEVVRFKVGCFEEDLAILGANAEVGRENGGLCADREVVGSARLLGKSLAAAGSRPEGDGAEAAGGERDYAEDAAFRVWATYPSVYSVAFCWTAANGCAPKGVKVSAYRA